MAKEKLQGFFQQIYCIYCFNEEAWGLLPPYIPRRQFTAPQAALPKIIIDFGWDLACLKRREQTHLHTHWIRHSLWEGSCFCGESLQGFPSCSHEQPDCCSSRHWKNTQWVEQKVPSSRGDRPPCSFQNVSRETFWRNVYCLCCPALEINRGQVSMTASLAPIVGNKICSTLFRLFYK